MEIAQIGTLSRIPSGFRLPNRNEKEATGGFQGRGAKGVYLSGRRQTRAGAHDQRNTSGCGRGEWSKAQRLASQQSRWRALHTDCAKGLHLHRRSNGRHLQSILQLQNQARYNHNTPLEETQHANYKLAKLGVVKQTVKGSFSSHTDAALTTIAVTPPECQKQRPKWSPNSRG